MIKGAKSYCPVCNSVDADFRPLRDFYIKNAQAYGYAHSGKGEMTPHDTYSCAVCGASDRERLYALWIIKKITNNELSANKMIHFAPEPALSKLIKASRLFENYKTADLIMKDVDYKVDLEKIPFPDESYDFFICSHVLEHVTDDIAAIRELFRITKIGGFGILMAPICMSLTKTVEDPSITDEGERWRLFGQHDHVRLYAHDDYVARLEAGGFNVQQLGKEYFGEKLFNLLGLKSTSILYIVSKSNNITEPLSITATPEQILLQFKNTALPTEEEIISHWKNPKDTPVVSILSLAYNHEKFIEDALKGFLIQKTDFPFEVLIHDDASTDKTADIIREYEKRFPNIIKPIYQVENQYSKGVSITNSFQYPRVKGKYIALCEGDDFWIDPLKLQKQINFLENNEECNICFHDVLNWFPDKKIAIDTGIENRYKNIVDKENINYKDLLQQGNFINTCSTVYRYRNSKLPETFRLSPVGDYLLHVHNSKKGKIKKVDGYMGVYRRGVGIYSTLDPISMTIKQIQYLAVLFDYLDELKDKVVIYNSFQQKINMLKHALDKTKIENLQLKNVMKQLASKGVRNAITRSKKADLRSLTISIKCCTPNRTEVGWGDTLFADALARAFEQLGYKCRVDFKEEWYTRLDTDIVIHLKGLFRYNPNPSTTNIIWIISHPELITKEELDDYDLVFCASESFTHKIKDACHASVHYLPQAGIPDVFRSDSNKTKDIDLLFVGNNRYSVNGSGRRIVADLLAIGESYKLAVVGQRWQGYVNSENILAEYIEPRKLGNLYARTKIALNDHHEIMRLEGFINNRTFDLALSNIFQISDRVKDLEKLSIITYYSIADLKSKVDYFLTNPRAREQFASSAYDKCRLYTFEYRAKQIIELLNSCLKDGKDADLRKKFGRAGNKIVTEGFNQATEVQKLSQIFNKCSANPVFNAYTLGVQCPICNTQPREFQSFGQTPGSNAQCPECGSLECDRLLWLFLQQHTKLFTTPNLKVLDVAPAQCLSARIQKIPRLHYLSIDNNSSHAMRQMDLTNLQLPDNCFDCLLCGYVPEFINDGKKAMSELVRVLKPGGWAIFQASFRNGKALKGEAVTDTAEDTGLSESPADVSTYDAEDFKARLESQGFTANVLPFAKSLPASDIRRYGLQVNEDIYFCFKA